MTTIETSTPIGVYGLAVELGCALEVTGPVDGTWTVTADCDEPTLLAGVDAHDADAVPPEEPPSPTEQILTAEDGTPWRAWLDSGGMWMTEPL